MPRISAIVAALNEQQRITSCLEALERQGFDERILVDGGSGDATLERAAPRATLILHSAAGRGRQLALGARHARGDVLLFLHADCRLPEGARESILSLLARPGVVAGAFRTCHVVDEREKGSLRARLLAPLLPIADLRSSYTRLPYGDQAIFVDAAAYRRAGGFRPIPIFEDVDLAERLWGQGRIEVLRACVSVSARRYLAHPLRAALAMNTLPALFRLGVSGERLRALYSRSG